MKPKTLHRVAVGAALTVLTLAASAAPIYLVDATTDGLAPDPGLSNVAFSWSYEDGDGDAMFSITELLAFTGLSTPGGDYYDLLLEVPTVSGIVGNGSGWLFGDSSGALLSIASPAGAFTPFTTGPLAGSVPEPGSFALAGLALLGWGGVSALGRRRVPAP